MATTPSEAREITWGYLLPWTAIFRGFQVALDLNKLLLAAGGILVMWFGWWLLSVLFTLNVSDNPPTFRQEPNEDWAAFKKRLDRWNLLNESAGINSTAVYRVADFADSETEYDYFTGGSGPKVETLQEYQDRVNALYEDGTIDKDGYRKFEQKTNLYRFLNRRKPYGRLSVGPWFEDRGPNPFLLVTNQAGVPWEAGHFWEWLIRDQFLVLIEPLVKFVRPLVYLFSPRASFWVRFYFLLVLLWTVGVWSLFGGAITRIAAVQVTRGERIGLIEALRFTLSRYLSYLTAPLFPLLFIIVILLLMFLFGLFHMIPLVGDILVSGLFWWGVVILGLLMAVALVGLIGWPLMAATISTEGSDAWEAVSRSYTYVYQRPWQFIWYVLVAIAYGSVIVFFVGFMGSLMVYLAEWGVSRIQPESRDPEYLFIYAPTSFDWRTLLLVDATVPAEASELAGQSVVQNGRINPAAYEAYAYNNTWSWYNRVGSWMVAFWMGLIFLLIVGFGYSYFWTASTIMYLLLRRSVDAAEMDEVYLEEDEQDTPYGTTLPGPAPTQRAPGDPHISTGKQQEPDMVASPQLRAPTGPPATIQPSTPPAGGSPPATPPAEPTQQPEASPPPASTPSEAPAGSETSSTPAPSSEDAEQARESEQATPSSPAPSDPEADSSKTSTSDDEEASGASSAPKEDPEKKS